MEFARELDLADRFLNTRAVRALLRANRVAQAEKVIALFTVDQETGYSNLHSMQALWWEQEMGAAYFRLGLLGKALKRFQTVESHFTTIRDDEHDFHAYCTRKFTLRSYVQMLRFEDQLYGSKAYVKAMCSMAEVYLALCEDAPRQTGDKKEKGKDELSKEERKAEQKRKRAEALKRAEADTQHQLLLQQQQEQQLQQQQQQAASGRRRVPAPDPDPEGATLLARPPLPEAQRCVAQLLIHAAHLPRVQLLALHTALRRGRLLLALRALLRLLQLQPLPAPATHLALVRFWHAVDQRLASLPPPVADLLREQRQQQLGSESLQQRNAAFAVANRTVAARTAVAHATLLMAPNDKQAAAALLLVEGEQLPGNLQDYHEAFELLQRTDAAAASTFQARAQKRFPFATNFATATNAAPPTTAEQRSA